MKILFLSERFFPSIGGIQTVTRLIGEALARAGQQTAVVTREGARGIAASRLEVFRRPGPLSLFRLCLGADALIVQGPVLRLSWPLLLVRRPALLVHHMPLGPDQLGLVQTLRAGLARRVRHAGVSQALAQQLPWPVEVVLPNPYDPAVFRTDWSIPRTKQVVFLGRLILEKGAHVLIEALGLLRRQGMRLRATIIGSGPEAARLEERATNLGLCSGLQFVGRITGAPLARVLNQHRVMVVPSICHEGFGVVALEGIACGCVLIASGVGGLPEAVGPCGMILPCGDSAVLAEALQRMLSTSDLLAGFRARAARHLARHHPDRVARQYLGVLSNLVCSSRGDARTDHLAASDLRGRAEVV